jgi:hypothetical protein
MIHWRKASFSERLRGERYKDADIQDVTSMNKQGPEDCFYLVDLDDRNVIAGRVAKDISWRERGPTRARSRRKERAAQALAVRPPGTGGVDFVLRSFQSVPMLPA